MDTVTRRKLIDANSNNDSTIPTPPTIDNNNDIPPVPPPPLPLTLPPTDNDDNKQKFINNAYNYLKIMKDLQDIVKAKQTILACMDKTQVIKIDKDPDESIGSKLPMWLSLLLDKYKSHMQSNDKPTLGKFSAFLSCCILKQISSSSDELEALASLLHASNDTVVHYDGNYNPSSAALLSSQPYLSKRIYAFISSLTELKSYIKDEKSIDNFSYFIK